MFLWVELNHTGLVPRPLLEYEYEPWSGAILCLISGEPWSGAILCLISGEPCNMNMSLGVGLFFA